MLFDEQDLKDRALRRIKYLEDSNYRRWSDITPRQNLEEESDYRDKKRLLYAEVLSSRWLCGQLRYGRTYSSEFR